jgi:hypothetical protein
MPSEDIEDLVRAVVKCDVCESTKLLQLLVNTSYISVQESIKPNYQSKTRLQSHYTRDNTYY